MTREELRKFEPLWDKWYVQEHLGGGSYGDVYRITCQVYERTYEAALKVISIPKDQSELNEIELNCETKEDTISYYDRIRQNITSEIDMMEQLKGRTNIVSFEDHDIRPHNNGKDPGYDIFIRMELLDDFNGVIGQESKRWTDNLQIVKLGMDIAEGLRICHSHNIIHRDIKPGNIFRSKDGDYKIGDFGIARSVSDAQLTMSVKGTFNYMAPEVYNREHYDLRADIYSLGMVMYYMLNKNRGPFLPLTEVPTVEQKNIALIRRMRGDQMISPLLAGEKLGNIILKACEYRKEDRFQSMEEFQQALSLLSREDMERPNDLLLNQKIADERMQRETLSEDDRTVAFVDLEDNKAVETVPIISHMQDDDCTVAMDVADIKASREQLAASPAETAEENRRHIGRENTGKKVYWGIAVGLLAVVCVCATFVLPKVFSKEPVAAGDMDQEERLDTLVADNIEQPEETAVEETIEPEEEKETDDKVVLPETSVQENVGPAAPFCSKEVVVKGGKASGGLVFEGDRLDDLKVRGEFQASETDNTKVEGTLVLEHSEEFINKSGEYSWTFTPDDVEHYETVTGKVHITAVHRDLIDGLDELKQVEDKEAVYQLALTDDGLTDLSILKGMTNLTVLVVSNNDITDISEIVNHPKLQQVYLDGNKNLKDVTPLYKLKKMNILELSGTAVSDEDRSKLEKQLAE